MKGDGGRKEKGGEMESEREEGRGNMKKTEKARGRE